MPGRCRHRDGLIGAMTDWTQVTWPPARAGVGVLPRRFRSWAPAVRVGLPPGGGSQAGEADAVRRPAHDAEAQLPDGTGWPTRSASGVTTTSALGVRFNRGCVVRRLPPLVTFP